MNLKNLIIFLAAQSEAADPVAVAVQVEKPEASSFLANINAKGKAIGQVQDWEEVGEAVGELIEEYWGVAQIDKFDKFKVAGGKLAAFQKGKGKPGVKGPYKGKFGGKWKGKYGKWNKKG